MVTVAIQYQLLLKHATGFLKEILMFIPSEILFSDCSKSSIKILMKIIGRRDRINFTKILLQDNLMIPYMRKENI